MVIMEIHKRQTKNIFIIFIFVSEFMIQIERLYKPCAVTKVTTIKNKLTS